MRFLKKKKKDISKGITVPQLSRKENHPFSLLNSYAPLKNTEFNLYRSLREAIPIIDGAVDRIVRLTGGFEVTCNNSIAEKRLNDFLKNVPVNACGKGINIFMNTYLDRLLTYGTAVGEILLNDNNDICGLYNSCIDNVKLYYDENPMDLKIAVKTESYDYKDVKYPQLISVTSLNPEPDEIYGNSLLKGLPFVSNILLKIFNTVGINWERVGNLRFAVTYNPGNDVSQRAFSKEYAMQIANEWSKAMKKSDEVRDFVAVGDVSIKVIGADNQILDSEIPVRQLLEQIIAKLAIPPFLLGLSWSSTERMSSQQADLLTSELEYYRRLLTPVIEKICNMWLRLEGYECLANIEWDNINLQDEVELATARLKNAQAMKIEQTLTKRGDVI